MKTKQFNNGLIVKSRKSAIIFEDADGKEEQVEYFIYDFSDDEFLSFVRYINEVANESWDNIQPKEANSWGSDYAEYYDRKYDDNGELDISKNQIDITAPYWSKDTLYQFNKPKIQSFIYDLNKLIKK